SNLPGTRLDPRPQDPAQVQINPGSANAAQLDPGSPAQVTPRWPDPAQLDRVANFIGLEVLRFLYGHTQLQALKEQKLIPPEAILLPRPPEPLDIAAPAAPPRRRRPPRRGSSSTRTRCSIKRRSRTTPRMVQASPRRSACMPNGSWACAWASRLRPATRRRRRHSVSPRCISRTPRASLR